MKPRSAEIIVPSLGGSAQVVPEPYGVVAVFSAWNYPLHLLLGPAAGAIAAVPLVCGKVILMESHLFNGCVVGQLRGFETVGDRCELLGPLPAARSQVSRPALLPRRLRTCSDG